MSPAAFETQTAFVTREMGEEASSLECECESLDDVGRNADLCYIYYISNT